MTTLTEGLARKQRGQDVQRYATVRPIRFCEGVAYVQLTRGYEAKIDVQDVALVADKNWCASQQGNRNYAYTSKRVVCSDGIVRYRKLALHRFLMTPEYHLHIDHVNGNGLDCRRYNMRLATPSQNACNQRISSRNTSGFKGVLFHKPKKRWVAYIAFKCKSYHLGYFDTATDAHEAYVKASSMLHREFGRIY